MSIQVREEDAAKIVVIALTGKLVKADYGQFSVEFQRLRQQNGKLRVLLDMNDFHGWDVGGLWEELKFDVKHRADLERLAIVGEKKWEHGMATICKPFTRAAIRYFNHAEMAAAHQWLEEGT